MFESVLALTQNPMLWLFFLLFFLFIIVAYKVVKLLIRALIIGVIAGLFPVFANLFLGLEIPITLGNILWFAMTGVEIYFVYHILLGIGKIADFIMKPFKGKKKTKTEKIIIKEKVKDKDAQ